MINRRYSRDYIAANLDKLAPPQEPNRPWNYEQSFHVAALPDKHGILRLCDERSVGYIRIHAQGEHTGRPIDCEACWRARLAVYTGRNSLEEEGYQ